MITKYLKRNNTFILIIVLLLIASFIVPNFIAYKFEQKRIEEQRILEGMAFFGPDVMNIINNMIDMILGVVDMAFGISDFITGLANMVLDVLTQAVAFANSILNAAITAITSASAIVQGLFAAFIVAGIAATIVFLGENIANWFEGVGNHIRCGGEEFGVGWYNTFKTLGIMIDCSWHKFINFINGHCTVYYIIDMLFGLLYGLFVKLPIILLNAIFGIDLQFVVDFLYELIVLPIDSIFFAISGFHLVKWSDPVIRKCYRCEGGYKIGGRDVKLYKRLNEWAELLNCSTEQIINGFIKMITSVIPGTKWSAWASGEHKPGWDDEPGFW